MRLNKRINWSVISIFLTLLAIIVAIIIWNDQKDRPNILFEIVNRTNVIDIHEPLTELKIEFKGKSINEENLNIQIIKVKVVNNGNVKILQNHYDMNDKWGIKVIGGDVTEVRLIECNSDYIESTLNPILVKELGIIELNKIIFEPGDFFILEFLVLHEKQVIPEIKVIGKVAGIRELTVIDKREETSKGVGNKIFDGSPVVHLVRSFLYFLFFIGIATTLVFISIWLSRLYKHGKKISKKKEFWKLLSGIETEAKKRYSRQLEILADIYAIRGKESLIVAKHLIEDSSREGSRIKQWLWYRNPLEGLSPLQEIKRQKDITTMEKVARILAIPEELEERDIAMALVDKRIVKKEENNEVVVDEYFKRILDELTIKPEE